MVQAREQSDDVRAQQERAEKLEGAIRVLDQDPNDLIACGQAAMIAPAFVGSGMETNLEYVLRNYAAVVRHADPRSLEYFTFNMTNSEIWIGRAAKARIMAHARAMWGTPFRGRPLFADEQAPRGASPAPHPQVPEHKTDPTVAAAIKALGVLSKIPGCQEAAGAIKAALELVEGSDDAAKRVKAVGELAEKMILVIGQVMEHAAHDRELAESAVEVLGKVAKVFATVTKVYTAINALTVLIAGHSLSGKKKTPEERAEAVVELAAVFGGIAVTLSVEGFKWIWNNIGVPAKDALTKAGLRQLFGGESPEALIARIEAMPVDPVHALDTMFTLATKTFLPVTSLFSRADTRELWEKFYKRELRSDADKTQRVYATRKQKPGENELTDLERSQLAERYRSLAVQFIREQVRQAEAWR